MSGGPAHRPVKRSVTIAGHRTSITLEEPFWTSLRRLADGRGVSVNRLVAEIDAARPDPSVSLTSALRVHVLLAALAGAAQPGGESSGSPSGASSGTP